MNNLICDIDGTIADNTHRLHYILGEKKDWDAFHASVDKDGVYEDMKQVLYSMYYWMKDANRDSRLLYVTGRMEKSRRATAMWLHNNNFPQGVLFMRQDDDYRADFALKAEIADKLNLTAGNTWLALDDRDQVVQMWRKRGIRCLQVRDGAF